MSDANDARATHGPDGTGATLGADRTGATSTGMAQPDARARTAKRAARRTRKQAEVRWKLRNQLPLVVILVLLWILLWGSFSALNVVTGVIIAIVVTRVFYLPSVELAGRFNLWHFLVFAGHFLVDLVRASFQVAALAFRGVETNSVIAVQLTSRSDLLVTLTAITISLIPGSIVVEVDRDRSILYLHVINTPDEASLVQARRDVLEVEKRIILTIGSASDVKKVTG